MTGLGSLSIEQAEKLANGEIWPDEQVRDRGILSDTDRQFLYGYKEYDSPSSRSERRAIIRERFLNGLQDLWYLPQLDVKQQRRIAEEFEEITREGTPRESLASLVCFLHHTFDQDEEWFEQTISQGIALAEAKQSPESRYGEMNVDVEIDISRGFDLDRIEQDLRNGREDQLTPAELGALLQAGRLESEDLEIFGSTGDDEQFVPEAPSFTSFE